MGHSLAIHYNHLVSTALLVAIIAFALSLRIRQPDSDFARFLAFLILSALFFLTGHLIWSVEYYLIHGRAKAYEEASATTDSVWVIAINIIILMLVSALYRSRKKFDLTDIKVTLVHSLTLIAAILGAALYILATTTGEAAARLTFLVYAILVSFVITMDLFLLRLYRKQALHSYWSMLIVASVIGAASIFLDAIRTNYGHSSLILVGQSLTNLMFASVLVGVLHFQERKAPMLSYNEMMARLESTESRYRQLVEQSRTPIINLTGGRPSSVNSAFERYFGISREQACDDDFDHLALLVEDDRHVLQAYLQNIEEGREVDHHLDFRVVDGTGRERQVEASMTHLTTEAEGVIVQAILRDVTRRKKLEAELQASNEELAAFVYTASHDLKTPVVSMTGFLGMLKEMERERLSDQGLHVISRIEDATEQMKQLLDELAIFTRVGREKLKLENLDLNLVVLSLYREFKPYLAGRPVILKIPNDLPTIAGDMVGIAQVFLNLILNGLKFLGEQPNPCVKLSWRQEGDLYHFQVADNGIGIEPAYHEKIFEPFQSLKDRRAGRVSSAGLGLSIVRRIVQRHGGEIWVESDGASGSTFHFTHPVTLIDSFATPGTQQVVIGARET